MKKMLAVVIAVSLAFGCGLTAFATTNVCQRCGNTFTDEHAYNEHLAACASLPAATSTPGDNFFADTEITDIINALVTAFQIEAGWWDSVEDIVIRIINFFEDMAFNAAGQGEVAGAVADLETEAEKLNIPDDIFSYIEGLIFSLKQKIKDLYAGSTEKTAVETTAAEAPAETGTAETAVYVFAALSVSAAAAYACVRKKDE